MQKKCLSLFAARRLQSRSEEHTSELQSLRHLVCRLLLEKKKTDPEGLAHQAEIKMKTNSNFVATPAGLCKQADLPVNTGSNFVANSPLDILFFFNDTATTEIYTLSLHDALPISEDVLPRVARECYKWLLSPTQNVPDRKSTRLNSSHLGISYAVFCLKKKKK